MHFCAPLLSKDFLFTDRNEVLLQIALQAAGELFTEDPGVAIIVGSPQSHGVHAKVHEHPVREYGEVFAQRNDGNDGKYIEGAIIDVVDFALSRAHAMEDFNYFENHMAPLIKTKKLLRFFHKTNIKLEAQKFQVTPEFKENPFKVLKNMKSGLSIVHLQQVKVFEYVVVVNAGRSLIFDNKKNSRFT